MISPRSLIHVWFVCVFLLIASLIGAPSTTARTTESTSFSSSQATQPAPTFLNSAQPSQPIANPDTIATSLASAPLIFIENVGQFGAGARYQMRGGNHTLWLAQDALWITLLEPASQVEHDEIDGLRTEQDVSADTPTRGVNIRLSFVGANPKPSLESFNRLDTTVSYFRGNDPDKWHPDVPVWGGVRYVDLYPGIDLEMSGNGGQFQPRLVVRESTALNQVQLLVDGAEGIGLVNTDGTNHSIQLTTAIGDVILPLFSLVRPDRSAFEWSVTPTLSENGIVNPFAPFGEIEQAQPVGIKGDALATAPSLVGEIRMKELELQ